MAVFHRQTYKIVPDDQGVWPFTDLTELTSLVIDNGWDPNAGKLRFEVAGSDDGPVVLAIVADFEEEAL